MSDTVCGAELRIPGDLKYLRPVRTFIRDLAESLGFCHDKAVDIGLVVDEVFSNAVEHGSAGSESQIKICLSSTDNMMRIVVSDSGQGKGSSERWLEAWSDAIKDKFQPDTERGHGLLLVYNLTDEVNMKPNPMGGLDVHLVVYKEG